MTTPNHTIDPKTGFLESNGFMSAFDGERKLAFLKNYEANGLRIRRACREMGLSEDTVSRHLKNDPVFKQAFDDVERDYIENLESVSRINALNPKSVIERIFQLKCILPEKYGQENKPSSQQIIFNIDGNFIQSMRQREQIIDAKVVEAVEADQQGLSAQECQK